MRKETEWSSCHAPLRDQHRPWGFWSKAMPSAAENDMLFEKTPPDMD